MTITANQIRDQFERERPGAKCDTYPFTYIAWLEERLLASRKRISWMSIELTRERRHRVGL